MLKTKKCIMYLFCIVFVFLLSNGIIVKAEEKDYIDINKTTVTVKEFDDALKKATGNTKSFVSKSFNITDTKKSMTNIQAAQLLYNAYRYKEGKTVPANVKALYDVVVNDKILRDATKIAKDNRKYARYAYVWGIMEGDLYRNYNNQRNFNEKDLVTGAEANTYISRIIDAKQRFKTTDKGQLIRTTNLPKNHKDFAYILANVPNEFYELPYYNKLSTWKSPDSDIIIPKNVLKSVLVHENADRGTLGDRPELLDIWVKRVIDNVTVRTNLSYKTIDNGQWKKDLKNTLWNYDIDKLEQEQNSRISEYIKLVKDNKLIIKGIDIFADESCVYTINGHPVVRYHLRVKVNSDLKNFKPKSQGNYKGVGLVYTDYSSSFFSNAFKLDKYYTILMDVPMQEGQATYDWSKFVLSVDDFHNCNVVDLNARLTFWKNFK